MSDEHMIDDNGPDGGEMEQRLRQYADARLSPSPDAVSRMRTAIVARAADAAAMRAFDIQRGGRAGVPARLAAERAARRFWLSRLRRAGTALLAAALMIGSVAAVLGATAGSPLYGARIWFEGLTLPASGDARAAAQVGQLDQRIAEVQRAALTNDQAAIRAALGAFETELTTALADAGDDSARLDQLETALGTHISVLTALEGTVPAEAVDAIAAAIDSSSKAIDVIEARLAGAPGGPTPGHTPPPHPTPRPTPNRPDRTAAPDRTPPPHPSPSHPAHP
jgi:hypothetical protein